MMCSRKLVVEDMSQGVTQLPSGARFQDVPEGQLLDKRKWMMRAVRILSFLQAHDIKALQTFTLGPDRPRAAGKIMIRCILPQKSPWVIFLSEGSNTLAEVENKYKARSVAWMHSPVAYFFPKGCDRWRCREFEDSRILAFIISMTFDIYDFLSWQEQGYRVHFC